MITDDTPKKTMREVIEAHKSMTHEDLIADQNVLSLCQLLGTILSNCDAADVAIAMACIFGSLAFDAEMQHALRTEQDRNDIPATFEERLELFGVHAKIAYEGVKKYVQAEQPYSDGKRAH